MKITIAYIKKFSSKNIQLLSMYNKKLHCYNLFFCLKVIEKYYIKFLLLILLIIIFYSDLFLQAVFGRRGGNSNANMCQYILNANCRNETLL